VSNAWPAPYKTGLQVRYIEGEALPQSAVLLSPNRAPRHEAVMGAGGLPGEYYTSRGVTFKIVAVIQPGLDSLDTFRCRRRIDPAAFAGPLEHRLDDMHFPAHVRVP
jgi:hypothetical protein